MKMYQLHLNKKHESEYVDFDLIRKGTCVHSQLDKRFDGFVTLYGDTIVLSEPTDSELLVGISEVFPLSYCYKVDTSTLDGVIVAQTISKWLRAEAYLKSLYNIEPEDTILYFKQLDRSLFVKTQFNSYSADCYGMTEEKPKEVLGKLRNYAFHSEMLRMARALAHSVESEQNSVRKIIATNRLKNMLEVCQTSGIKVPEHINRLTKETVIDNDEGIGDFD